MVTVGVLGPVEVRRDGERVAVPGGKTTELLVRLALEAGRTVRSERLIDDLWGDEGVGTAKNTLSRRCHSYARRSEILSWSKAALPAIRWRWIHRRWMQSRCAGSP